MPEGVYRVIALNPNSSYHLSMKLDYPNAWDLERAAEDGRQDVGSNIFIHGGSRSIGCLAMGDPEIEELFVLAHDVGLESIRVLIAPHDPRDRPLDPSEPTAPPWLDALYTRLSAEILEITG